MAVMRAEFTAPMMFVIRGARWHASGNHTLPAGPITLTRSDDDAEPGVVDCRHLPYAGGTR